MKIDLCEVDTNGFVVGHYPVLCNDQGNPIGEVSESLVTVKCTDGLHKPKWTGTEWVEGLTQEEIDAINNVVQEPTTEEKLRLEQAQANSEMIDLMMAMMGGA